MQKEIITITGKPGSGKTTTANILAKTLGYERYSAGSFIRQIAQDRGISIEEASREAIKDPAIDREMDELVKNIGETRDRIVIDGRLAFYFIPQSFKVYLDLDLQIAAARIFASNDQTRQTSGDIGATPEETCARLERRLDAEQERYQTLYGINPHDTTQFDLVLDTKTEPPEQIAEQILRAYAAWRA